MCIFDVFAMKILINKIMNILQGLKITNYYHVFYITYESVKTSKSSAVLMKSIV